MTTKITELKHEEILDRLHTYVTQTGNVLKDDKRELADQKMIKILEDGLIQELMNKKKDEDKIKDNFIDSSVYDEIEFVLLKFYYAIYNDNVELYKKIVDKNISLGKSVYENRLYLLNKELRDIFKNDKEYFEFISINNPAIKRFYSSIGNQDSEERDGYIESFCKIIKGDKRYLSRKKNEYPGIFMNVLTDRNLRVFGEEFLKNATNKQKEVINTFIYNISDEDLVKVGELIKKYPQYKVHCKLETEFIREFTIDELGEMNLRQTIIYNKAAKQGILPLLKEAIKLKPNFDCPDHFIDKDVFETIPVDTIVLLSYNAMTDITKVKHNERYKKNVNKIVRKDLYKLKDIVKKKLEKKKNNKKTKTK